MARFPRASPWEYVNGKDPGVVGTYLVIGEKAMMYATLSDLSEFFKGLR